MAFIIDDTAITYTFSGSVRVALVYDEYANAYDAYGYMRGWWCWADVSDGDWQILNCRIIDYIPPEEPEIYGYYVMGIDLQVETDDGRVTTTYTWNQPEGQYGIEPYDLNINYTITVSVPVRWTGEISQCEVPSGLPEGKIWRSYVTSRSASWFIDQRLTRRLVRNIEQDVTLAWSFGSQTGNGTANTLVETLYKPCRMAVAMDGIADSRSDETHWGTLAVCELTIDGLASPHFGERSYVNSSDYACLSLNDNAITYSAPYTGEEASGVTVENCISAYAVTYDPDIAYCDGHSITADVVVSGEVPTWNPSTKTWEVDSGETTIDSVASLQYGGWWRITGLYPLTGDYQVNTTTAEFKQVYPLWTQDDPEWYVDICGRVDDPPLLGQPGWAAKPGEDDADWSDCRCLIPFEDEQLTTDTVLTVTRTHTTRQLVTWTYAGRGDWTLSDSEHFTFTSGPGGELVVTCNNDNGWMSIDYEDCRSENVAATDTWLGCRYLELLVSSSDSSEFEIEVAGRQYTVSADKPLIDVLAAASTPQATQSLLPTFLPEQTDDSGNPDPPTVTDVPLDWGIYKPGTITLRNMRNGSSYTISGLRVVNKTSPVVVILPEGGWAGYQQDSERDPSSDPAAYHYAGTGGTENHRVDFYAHRTGYVIVDGLISHEIIGNLYRYLYESDDWGTAEPGLYANNSGLYQGEYYRSFPHEATPLITVEYAGSGERGWAYTWAESGSVAYIPIGYLSPGYYSGSSIAISAALRTTTERLPAGLNISRTVEKRFGGLGLIRVIDPRRELSTRTLLVSTGCEGNYETATDSAENYLTWREAGNTRTLKQYAADGSLHTYTAVVDGSAEATSEVRNRAVYLSIAVSGGTATASSIAAAQSRRTRRYYVGAIV